VCPHYGQAFQSAKNRRIKGFVSVLSIRVTAKAAYQREPFQSIFRILAVYLRVT